MLKGKDSEQIKKLGISEEQIEWQLSVFTKGVPYMKLSRATTINDGIIKLEKKEEKRLCTKTLKFISIYNVLNILIY